MLKFIGKRVLMLIPVLIGVSLIVFTLMQLSPGDPAMIILGAQAAPEDIRTACRCSASFWKPCPIPRS